MSAPGYDVIGDVHGHADKVTGLLDRLGYSEQRGAWRHPHRTAVFLGDLIDRGPEQVRTVELVRAMVDAGAARIVLGNHEFNAIAWATEHPTTRQPLREHSDKNRAQHAVFLAEVTEGSTLHAELISWFMTIPLWLDLGALRVVHACWDPRSMDVLAPLLSDTRSMTLDAMVEASRRGSAAYDAVETLLKGPEIDLPEGFGYWDKDDHFRQRARFSWWDGEATTLRRGAEIPNNATNADGQPLPPLPDTPIGDAALPRYDEPIPIIYGHYWRTGTPTIVHPNAACVDYSAGKGGPLVAYRWNDDDNMLSDDRFVSYP